MKGSSMVEALSALQDVPIVAVNKSFQISNWNKEAETHFGYTKDDLINNIFSEIIATNIDEFILSLQSENKITRMDNIQIISKTDNLIDCSLLAVPLQNGRDETFQIYCYTIFAHILSNTLNFIFTYIGIINCF